MVIMGVVEVETCGVGGGVRRNGGSGDLEAVMVSRIFFIVIGQEQR
jgi:hypothetical protein